MTGTFDLFAIAAPGLEPIVARELAALGEEPRIEEGGVAWSGDGRSLMRANLWLRTASRVLVRVTSFRATAFHELERRARAIDWRRFTGGRGAEFRVTARKSRLYHSDAIAERLATSASAAARAALGTRATRAARRPASAGPAQLFVVRAVRDVFEISADTSGELLHMRGYRLQTGKAPLRETLAAALLIAADWRGETPLVDPFCGSGTIPIEGALLARRMAPGARRDFAFMQWPGFEAKTWRALLAQAAAAALPSCPVAIRGADRDAGAIEASRANAARAGVGADIEFTRASVSGLTRPAEAGLLATNPPYGKRVSEGEEVRNVYARFGDVARRALAGWTVAMYAPDVQLVRQTRLRLEPRIRTVNGGIRVTAWVGEAGLP